jgi:uncharacterized protein YjiS (DUF1127 family)
VSGAVPLIVLGVRRSGTTLLRVMLDRNSELAIPDESYLVPQLAHRHRGTPDPDRFLDDLRRLPTLRDWGISPEDVHARLRVGMTTGEAIAAVYETYAAMRGKPRWGDKTPLYMEYLSLFERLFPEAQFVHLVRDGRDAALSMLDLPEGVVTRTWPHPASLRGFACQWRREVRAARALGRRVGPSRYAEVLYERLVADPERELRRICEFAALPFEAEMLRYHDDLDVSEKPHQQRLRAAPTAGVRDWRRDLPAADARAFEEIAGDLLADFGYETSVRNATPGARLRRARYGGKVAAWKAAVTAFQRSPLWAARHPPLA